MRALVFWAVLGVLGTVVAVSGLAAAADVLTRRRTPPRGDGSPRR